MKEDDEGWVLGCFFILGIVGSVFGVGYWILGWKITLLIVVVLFLILRSSNSAKEKDDSEAPLTVKTWNRKSVRLDRFKSSGAAKRNIIVSMPSPDSEAHRLLKKATEFKNQGDMDMAIATLKQAYKSIEENDVIHSVKEFLRLPAYLQKAGRNDEAWMQFNKLLTEGYPNQPKDHALIPMDLSQIYDKMRLFMQRDGKPKEAIDFGIFSIIYWQVGLWYQRRYDEIAELEDVKVEVKKLLKKAKLEDRTNVVSKMVFGRIQKLPKLDTAQVTKSISELLA